ncbi:hypothetical protein PsorP6_006188 [Peronosclerospora sorghi]|uniref:Uncharacterized protein n=1 Tax=Peronosclerospora sorghi TaxID=230839 RepID=A0ACC0W165_9STRA|nr:hypothetical protein PsorP6_006188 [Peronosclerospora sorghi]
MSGNKNPMNNKLEELVEKAGVAKQVLDLEQVVCDDLWTEERKSCTVAFKSGQVDDPAFWQTLSTLGLRDLGVVPELGHTRTLLEVGCGFGNAALPLLANNPALRIVAIDFAESAIELLKNQPLYDEARVAASVCDITQEPLPNAAFANGGVDFALFSFCLSALHPDKIKVQ